MSRRTEIQVGITVLVALIVLLWGVTWLKDLTLRRKVHVWHVRFPQTGGLGASDEVQVNGIRKGAVDKLRLAGDQVMVDLALDADVHLTTDCRVAIRNVGLMGEKVIAVDLRTTGTPYADRDTISGVYELGMPEVMANLGGTMQAVDHLASQLDHVATAFSKNGDLDKTMANFRVTSEQLQQTVAENRKLLHQTLEDLSQTAATTKELTSGREAQFKRTLDSFERASQNLERLSGRLDSLRAQFQSVASKVDRGNGSLGQLVNDPKLYDDMRASVAALNALLADIKANPKKYINLKIF